DYLRRFPQFAARFQQQVELHRALADGSVATTMAPGREHAAGPRDDTLATQALEKPTPPVPSVAGYEVLSELGGGGVGVYYKARQTNLNRLVALKMILSGAHASPQELARFKAEAEAVARLQHPNIVQVFELGEQGGRPYFSLEFVGGGSL